MDFKTFEFTEEEGDAVIILTETDEESAFKRLEEITTKPFRLSHIGN